MDEVCVLPNRFIPSLKRNRDITIIHHPAKCHQNQSITFWDNLGTDSPTHRHTQTQTDTYTPMKIIPVQGPGNHKHEYRTFHYNIWGRADPALSLSNRTTYLCSIRAKNSSLQIFLKSKFIFKWVIPWKCQPKTGFWKLAIKLKSNIF